MNHPDWSGWRFAGPELVTPSRQRVNARVLEHLIAMHHTRLHFERVGWRRKPGPQRKSGQPGGAGSSCALSW